MTNEDRKAAVDAIAAQIKACTLCGLHACRTNAVPGAGPVPVDIMFIGEGPGHHEDQQGLPFVGQSGHYLEKLLAMIKLNRHQVFIGNVVKCRPPDNRDPLPVEVETCTKTYLYRQIALINPKVIATLGRFGMGLFFPNGKISAIHGKPKWEGGRAYLPLYHPAAVLRNMKDLGPVMEMDFKKIPQLVAEWETRVNGASGAKPDVPPEPPTQLSLF
jgi:DNA polymerase